jgi:hypothetical protein
MMDCCVSSSHWPPAVNKERVVTNDHLSRLLITVSKSVLITLLEKLACLLYIIVVQFSVIQISWRRMEG